MHSGTTLCVPMSQFVIFFSSGNKIRLPFLNSCWLHNWHFIDKTCSVIPECRRWNHCRTEIWDDKNERHGVSQFLISISYYSRLFTNFLLMIAYKNAVIEFLLYIILIFYNIYLIKLQISPFIILRFLNVGNSWPFFISFFRYHNNHTLFITWKSLQ